MQYSLNWHLRFLFLMKFSIKYLFFPFAFVLNLLTFVSFIYSVIHNNCRWLISCKRKSLITLNWCVCCLCRTCLLFTGTWVSSETVKLNIICITILRSRLGQLFTSTIHYTCVSGVLMLIDCGIALNDGRSNERPM